MRSDAKRYLAQSSLRIQAEPNRGTGNNNPFLRPSDTAWPLDQVTLSADYWLVFTLRLRSINERQVGEANLTVRPVADTVGAAMASGRRHPG